jgi:amidase
MLEAGATITGTSTCEALCVSGGSHTAASGPVRNPHDVTRSSGGSSSGSAVLVATGRVDVGIGTDQAGSVRIPSAWCGIYGLKPTRGLLGYDAALSFDSRLDHIGLMARSAPEIAACLEAASGERPPHDSVPWRPRIAVLREGFDRPESEADVDQQILALAGQLADLGAEVEEISMPEHTTAMDATAVLATIGLTVMASSHDETSGLPGLREMLSDAMQRSAFPPPVAASLLAGLWACGSGRPGHRRRALALADRVTQAYDHVLANHDIILMPTVPTQATRLPTPDDTVTEHVRRSVASGNTAAANLTGHPALSVPCPVHGLPVGAMLVGRVGADHWLLGFADHLAHAGIL